MSPAPQAVGLATLVALLAIGCFAAPPPPALPTQLGGCHPGAYSTLSELSCERDSDCLLCGEECQLTTRSQVALTNEPCPPLTEAACEGARPACCQGRCVSSLGPPTF